MKAGKKVLQHWPRAVHQQPVASLRRRPLGHRGSSFAETSGRNFDFRPVRESSGGHRRQLRVRIADDGSVHPSSVDLCQLHGVASEAAAQENETGQDIKLFTAVSYDFS